MKAKEMIFNVKPGAIPKEPKYLTLNRTVGLSFLKEILRTSIFYFICSFCID